MERRLLGIQSMINNLAEELSFDPYSRTEAKIYGTIEECEQNLHSIKISLEEIQDTIDESEDADAELAEVVNDVFDEIYEADDTLTEAMELFDEEDEDEYEADDFELDGIDIDALSEALETAVNRLNNAAEKLDDALRLVG